MMLFSLLQSTPTPGYTAAPMEAPWWFTVALLPLAMWIGAVVWPWIAKRLDKQAEQREKDEDEERARRIALEERGIVAQERMAESLGQIRRFMEAMDWRWSAIESYLDPERRGRKVYPPDHKRLVSRERGGGREDEP